MLSRTVCNFFLFLSVFLCFFVIGQGYSCNNCTRIDGLPCVLHAPVEFRDATDDTSYSLFPDKTLASDKNFKEYFQKQFKDHVLPALRVVDFSGSIGTGFYIDGRFITNAHILKNYSKNDTDEAENSNSPPIVIKNPIFPGYADFALLLNKNYKKALNFLLNQFEDGGISGEILFQIYFYVEFNLLEQSYQLHFVDLLEDENYKTYKIKNNGKAKYGISGSPIVRATVPKHWNQPYNDRISFDLQDIIYARPKDDHKKVVVLTPKESITESYIKLLELAKNEKESYSLNYNTKEEKEVDENLDLLALSNEPNLNIYGEIQFENFSEYVKIGKISRTLESHRSHIISKKILKYFIDTRYSKFSNNLDKGLTQKERKNHQAKFWKDIVDKFKQIAGENEISLFDCDKYTDKSNAQSLIIFNPGNLCIGPLNDANRRIKISMMRKKMLNNDLSPRYRPPQFEKDTNVKYLTSPYPVSSVDYESIFRLSIGSSVEQEQAYLLNLSLEYLDNDDLDNFLVSWANLLIKFGQKKENAGYYVFDWKNAGTVDEPNLHIARQERTKTDKVKPDRECCRIF